MIAQRMAVRFAHRHIVMDFLRLEFFVCFFFLSRSLVVDRTVVLTNLFPFVRSSFVLYSAVLQILSDAEIMRKKQEAARAKKAAEEAAKAGKS